MRLLQELLLLPKMGERQCLAEVFKKLVKILVELHFGPCLLGKKRLTISNYRPWA